MDNKEKEHRTPHQTKGKKQHQDLTSRGKKETRMQEESRGTDSGKTDYTATGGAGGRLTREDDYDEAMNPSGENTGRRRSEEDQDHEDDEDADESHRKVWSTDVQPQSGEQNDRRTEYGSSQAFSPHEYDRIMDDYERGFKDGIYHASRRYNERRYDEELSNAYRNEYDQPREMSKRRSNYGQAETGRRQERHPYASSKRQHDYRSEGPDYEESYRGYRYQPEERERRNHDGDSRRRGSYSPRAGYEPEGIQDYREQYEDRRSDRPRENERPDQYREW